jgi:hypothetical protein
MKKLPLGILGSATVAAAAVAFVSFQTKQPKLTHKETVLRGPASHQHKVNAKVSGNYQVEIRSLKSPVSEAGDQISLEATITSVQDVDMAYFAWNLPEGVRAQSPLTGELGPLATGESKTIVLEATSATEENQHIHLHVFRKVDGENLGLMTQYNTRDQEKIEERLRTKAENLAAKQASGEARQKIMQ